MSKERDAYYRRVEVGAVHTPMEVAHRIAARFPLSLMQAETTFFDPACGNGNLLVAVAEWKIALGYEASTIAASLFGNDINAEAVAECKQRLAELLGVPPPEDNFTVSDWIKDGR